MDFTSSIRSNPLLNPTTTVIANTCEIITALITLMNDLMSNNCAKFIISRRLNASINFPLCRYLFNNPMIKHRYVSTNRIMPINDSIMLLFMFTFAI